MIKPTRKYVNHSSVFHGYVCVVEDLFAHLTRIEDVVRLFHNFLDPLVAG